MTYVHSLLSYLVCRLMNLTLTWEGLERVYELESPLFRGRNAVTFWEDRNQFCITQKLQMQTSNLSMQIQHQLTTFRHNTNDAKQKRYVTQIYATNSHM